MARMQKIKKICFILITLFFLGLLFKYHKIVVITCLQYYSAFKTRMGMFLLNAIIIFILSSTGILICWMLGKHRDKKLISIQGRFSNRYPRLNSIIGLELLIIIVDAFAVAVWYLGIRINTLVNWISQVASKMDAVVIVALITGTVSIIGVIISSIVAKIIDYRKNRQDYLARKREEPYGEFVEMIYKIQQNAKNNGSYTEEMMLEDLSKFSKQITLWGSPNVVNKWVQFRENGAKPDSGKTNLFLLEEIMNEMRKDLGLKKVKKGNLLAFFVNDIKNYINVKK